MQVTLVLLRSPPSAQAGSGDPAGDSIAFFVRRPATARLGPTLVSTQCRSEMNVLPFKPGVKHPPRRRGPFENDLQRTRHSFRLDLNACPNFLVSPPLSCNRRACVPCPNPPCVFFNMEFSHPPGRHVARPSGVVVSVFLCFFSQPSPLMLLLWTRARITPVPPPFVVGPAPTPYPNIPPHP